MSGSCWRCGHDRSQHGRECDLYDSTSRREVCLECGGYEEPGYPTGMSWHRFAAPVEASPEEGKCDECFASRGHRWVCEFCHETFYGDTLPHEWDWVFQSAVCPACIPRVKADGGYAVVLGGAYAGNRPDPRDRDLALEVTTA